MGVSLSHLLTASMAGLLLLLLLLGSLEHQKTPEQTQQTLTQNIPLITAPVLSAGLY